MCILEQFTEKRQTACSRSENKLRIMKQNIVLTTITEKNFQKHLT